MLLRTVAAVVDAAVAAAALVDAAAAVVCIYSARGHGTALPSRPMVQQTAAAASPGSDWLHDRYHHCCQRHYRCCGDVVAIAAAVVAIAAAVAAIVAAAVRTGRPVRCNGRDGREMATDRAVAERPKQTSCLRFARKTPAVTTIRTPARDTTQHNKNTDTREPQASVRE